MSNLHYLTRPAKLSNDQRVTDNVFAAVREVAAGTPTFRPGDIASHLRDKGQPMGAWEIRGELSRLEAAGLISNDPITGAWSVIEESRQVG